MRKIILWYNKNRKTLLIFFGGFIVIFLSIQLFNYFERRNSRNNVKNNIIENKIDYQLNSIKIDDDKSVISGIDLTENQMKSTKVIDDFVMCCNEGRIEDAYELISEDCKKELYPILEDFKQSYYDKVFNGGNKKVSIENWISNIYKVKFNTDSLSTGIYSEEGLIQDYITIISDEKGNYRLNINSYLGKQKTNVYQDFENIHIEVLEIDTYMDFQKYTYKICNNSNYNILLDSKKNINSIYIEDENNVEYPAMTHEISENELKLLPNETKTIKIKYYNKFNSEKKIKNAVFSNITINNADINVKKNIIIKIQF